MLYYSYKKLQDKRVANDPSMELPTVCLLQAITDIFRSMPMRVGAFHLCLPERPAAYIFNPIIVMAFNKEILVRVRVHDGSVLECMVSAYDVICTEAEGKTDVNKPSCPAYSLVRDFVLLRYCRDPTRPP